MRNVNLHEQPDVEIKVLTTELDDFEKSREEGHTDDASNQMSLDSVANEQLQGLLVESMSLLDHKGLVERERQGDDSRKDGQQNKKDDGLSDLKR